jgi:flavin-dependent dehydrogenase
VIRAAGDAYDAVVIGGGPAGSAAAHLLAAWDWSVLLVHHANARPSLAESLPPSTRKLLAVVGALDAVDRAGFHPNVGNVAQWASARRSTTTEAPGFHVRRDEFDRVLRDAAAAARVQIVAGVVRGVDPGDPSRVQYAADGEIRVVHARQVLDCSGRTGVVSARGFRRLDAGYRTLAVNAEWESDAWPADDRARTLVESYADGWAWSVPLSPTRRHCTVMIGDQLRNGGRDISGVYATELSKPPMISARLRDARAKQVGVAWACDASIYDCTRAADEGILLVGDAASFIEPLSSAGVKKALLSAWRAAVVTNTSLKDRSRAAAARDLYSQREREVYADAMRQSGSFFAEAASVYASPFWSVRAGHTRAAGVASTSIAGAEWTDEALGRDDDVLAAFEYLRRTDGVRLHLADTLRFEPVPAIEGREVVLRDGVVLPGTAGAVPFAAGVDLAALARLARGGRDVGSLIAAYQSEVARVPISGLLTGLSLLVSRRALVAEETPSSRQGSMVHGSRF